MPLLYPPLFTPSLHRETHQADGVDEINVKGLSILTSGLDVDKPAPAKPGRLYWALDSGILYRDNGNQWIKIAVKDFPDLDESSHKTTHQDGGSDELLVTGLSGLLADAQTPLAHKTTHQDGGSDELLVTGLPGLLADAQTPLIHKTTHQDGGSDELLVTGLSGLLADPQTPITKRALGKPTNNQTIMPNTGTKVNIDYAVYNPDGILNTADKRFIIPQKGLYPIIAHAHYQSVPADTQYGLYVYKNGVDYGQSCCMHTSQAGDIDVPSSKEALLNVNDYLELYTWHNAVFPEVLRAFYTYMSVHLLSPEP